MFELWDAELGISLGSFDSEGEALDAIRRLCDQSHGSRAPIGLIQDGKTVVATGDALVDRALSGFRPSPTHDSQLKTHDAQ